MGVLDTDLITRLVRATNDSKPEKNEGVLYGTVVDDGIRKYVHLDGSDGSVNTPVVTTTDINAGDTVLVQLKNHTATVTGNITDPAIGVKRAEGIESRITQTASEIRLEVKNEISKVQSSITETADSIRLEVSDDIANVRSSITEMASAIRLEVSDAVSGLDSRITQNAGKIESLVSGQNGLETRIEQTESGITSIVKNQEGFSQFKQTVEGFSFMGAGGTTKISGGDIVLTGSITWADLDEDLTVDMEKVSSDASSAAGSASSAANSATSAANSATSAGGSATNASNYALSASNSATNAANYASNASAYASNASTYSGKAASYASQALANANSAADAKNAIQSIYNDIQYNLPDYLDSTTITNVSLSSPVIIGGMFYSVGQDGWLEMESDGLRMYVEDAVKPKFEVINADSFIGMILGAGDNGGNNRLHIEKTRNSASIMFTTTNGTNVGLLFADDGNIYKYPSGTVL